MGSNGTKAVALALLGAQVTVVDVSPGNAEYARQLATAAGVDLQYEVCDVLKMPPQLLSGEGVEMYRSSSCHARESRRYRPLHRTLCVGT
jgi:threonine dehydrogenase-like Zn-dependent dehydrogenase